ncbi:MAG: type IV secretory system conjugative DNA transfer family protein, partial [Alphaproteobacteria bacterium]|nr:type IV secretory system conjugative DNA transfer family protein [Alphaproteobacteria bacterium]
FLMLPQELKLLARSKAILLMAGVPPIIAEKIVYYEDKAFIERVLPAPRLEAPKGRSTALLDAEIKELRSEVAELRAVFRARPLSDDEIADPSTIPSDATFDFGDVDVDLEGLSEEELKAWPLNYIDAQAIEPAKRKSRGARHG